MIVVCFYWQGDRWQQQGFRDQEGYKNKLQHQLNRAGQITDDLPARYINNLYKGVKQFADRDFQFICFTNEKLTGLDSNINVCTFPMVTRCGVLPRLFMFSRGAGLFGHQVLCIDIDVIVVGSLAPLMKYDGLFCARSKFKPGETFKLDGDVMSFRAGEETEKIFWLPFIKDVDAAVELTQGRERYWVRHVANDLADRWDKVAPGVVLSYKWHAKGKPVPPKGASIISCHGMPRPHQVKDKWIKEYWQ
ncbi:MAG: hypothetical protein A2Y71_06195 [Bacteroidetes bacterium RBG_13_42_15]|nr:MAG: hypothetical protein A2Y71_06195 [Bacteroidetes bacterium RBG_13_42_15]